MRRIASESVRKKATIQYAVASNGMMVKDEFGRTMSKEYADAGSPYVIRSTVSKQNVEFPKLR